MNNQRVSDTQLIMEAQKIGKRRTEMDAKEKMGELARRMETLMEENGLMPDGQTRDMMAQAYLKGAADTLRKMEEK